MLTTTLLLIALTMVGKGNCHHSPLADITQSLFGGDDRCLVLDVQLRPGKVIPLEAWEGRQHLLISNVSRVNYGKYSGWIEKVAFCVVAVVHESQEGLKVPLTTIRLIENVRRHVTVIAGEAESPMLSKRPVIWIGNGLNQVSWCTAPIQRDNCQTLQVKITTRCPSVIKDSPHQMTFQNIWKVGKFKEDLVSRCDNPMRSQTLVYGYVNIRTQVFSKQTDGGIFRPGIPKLDNDVYGGLVYRLFHLLAEKYDFVPEMKETFIGKFSFFGNSLATGSAGEVQSIGFNYHSVLHFPQFCVSLLRLTLLT